MNRFPAHRRLSLFQIREAQMVSRLLKSSVSVGDSVSEGDTLIVLESDKASMEIPAPASGVVEALKVSEGQQVVQGDPICEVSGGDATDLQSLH